MVDFNRRANLVLCYLHFLSILRRQEARRVPRRHSRGLSRSHERRPEVTRVIVQCDYTAHVFRPFGQVAKRQNATFEVQDSTRVSSTQ